MKKRGRKRGREDERERKVRRKRKLEGKERILSPHKLFPAFRAICNLTSRIQRRRRS